MDPATAAAIRQELLVGNGTEPQELDPHTTTGLPESRIIGTLLEGLTRLDRQNLSPLPAAAQSWEVSADRTRYTFFLRPSARWSNGDPVTAQDFVYSWRRLLSPAIGNEYAFMLFPIVNAENFHQGKREFTEVGVRALDRHTLEVRLEKPIPYFLQILAHNSTFPVHPPTIERFGRIDQRGTAWTRPGRFVGNGAFTLETWQLQRRIIVRKNPLYWDAERVRLEKIHFFPLENTTTEERMFRTGHLHLSSTVPTDKLRWYRQHNPSALMVHPYFGTYYYAFNTTRTPYRDPRVRQALSLAVDRQQLVDAVLQGDASPAHSFTPPRLADYQPGTRLDFDPAQARALLAEAGYPDGKGFPVTEILYNTSEGHRKIAVALQQMWKRHLNIDIRLHNQEWKVYLNSRRQQDYDVARAGWIGDYPDPTTFLDLMTSYNGNNHTGWSDPGYDALLKQAATVADRAERNRLLLEAEAELLKAMPVMPLYIYNSRRLIHPRVRGWRSNLLEKIDFSRLYLDDSPVSPQPGDDPSPTASRWRESVHLGASAAETGGQSSMTADPDGQQLPSPPPTTMQKPR